VSQVPQLSNSALPFGVPAQSAQLVSSPPHTPHSSSTKLPPQLPEQSCTQSFPESASHVPHSSSTLSPFGTPAQSSQSLPSLSPTTHPQSLSQPVPSHSPKQSCTLEKHASSLSSLLATKPLGTFASQKLSAEPDPRPSPSASE